MSQALNGEATEPGKPQKDTHPEEHRSMEAAKKAFDKAKNGSQKKPGITFAAQDKLPKLPIPPLDKTLKRYLASLKPLQSSREHAESTQAAEEFLKGEGPALDERLKKYAEGKTSYIEQFCKLRGCALGRPI